MLGQLAPGFTTARAAETRSLRVPTSTFVREALQSRRLSAA